MENWIRVVEIRYGTVDKLPNRNGKDEVRYRQLALKFIKLELPKTIKLKIEPNTAHNLKYERRRIMQWFWRQFGPHYLESRLIVDNKEVIWLELWRGSKWYVPFEGQPRTDKVRKKRKQKSL